MVFPADCGKGQCACLYRLGLVLAATLMLKKKKIENKKLKTIFSIFGSGDYRDARAREVAVK